MSTDRHLQRLEQLVDLREREVERLSIDMAGKQAVRRRYLGNLARLEELRDSSGPSGAQSRTAQATALSPALSLNCGGYKQAVMQMADAHRSDLLLHESQLAATQRLVMAAVRRHEALDLVFERQREGLRRGRNVREQKGQDELASQVWWRSRK